MLGCRDKHCTIFWNTLYVTIKSVSDHLDEIVYPVLKIDWILDIFLWTDYFQEKFIWFFQTKIAITRPKMKILSSVF